jgi:hypothetical protein
MWELTDNPSVWRELGCLNVGLAPDKRALLDECQCLGHVPFDQAPRGNVAGLHRCSCNICKIRWTYDSGD